MAKIYLSEKTHTHSEYLPIAGGTMTGKLTVNNAITATGTITGNLFSGSGASLSSLNASNISSGTLAAARLATSGVTAGTYGPTANVTGSNNTTINVPQIVVDTYGRVTKVTNFTLTNVNTDTNTTYSNMTGASTSAAGKAGLVPAPAAGAATRYLRSDGTWQVPPNTTYSAASTTVAGLMSAADKVKLNGITAYSIAWDCNGGAGTPPAGTLKSGYNKCWWDIAKTNVMAFITITHNQGVSSVVVPPDYFESGALLNARGVYNNQHITTNVYASRSGNVRLIQVDASYGATINAVWFAW